jgi:hypothetical protein
MIDAFKTNTEDVLYEQLTYKLRNATEENRAVVRRKTAALKRGYWWIVVTALLLAIFGIVFVADKWNSFSALRSN